MNCMFVINRFVNLGYGFFLFTPELHEALNVAVENPLLVKVSSLCSAAPLEEETSARCTFCTKCCSPLISEMGKNV